VRQETAAVQYFDPAYRRFGAFSSELVWTKRSLGSAMPPIATEFTRHDESSRSAKNPTSARLLDHFIGNASTVAGTSRPIALAVSHLPGPRAFVSAAAVRYLL
jgi:hypothetical protein